MRLFVWILIAIAMAGCGGGSADGEPASELASSSASGPAPGATATTPPVNANQVVARDSAGIRIIEISEAQLRALPVWRLAAAPTTSIGAVDGDARQLFDGIGGFARLADGTFALVDGTSSIRGSAEVRIFDSTGKFIRAVGRKGEGPDEFASPPSIRPRSEGGFATIVNARVRIFDAEMKITENYTLDLQPCPHNCSERGVLGSGSIPFYSSDRPPFGRDLPTDQTIDGLKAYYGVANRSGQKIVDSVLLPQHKVVVRPAQGIPGGRGTISEAKLVSRPILSLAPESGITGGQDHFAVISPDESELTVYRADGSKSHIIRFTAERVRVSAAEKQALLERANASLVIPGRVPGDYWPLFGTVRFGDDDDLWVSDYDRTTSDASSVERVTLFGGNGIPIARLEVRADPIWKDQERAALFRAQSGRDWYRMITTDSLGVMRLLVFDILKDPR